MYIRVLGLVSKSGFAVTGNHKGRPMKRLISLPNHNDGQLCAVKVTYPSSRYPHKSLVMSLGHVKVELTSKGFLPYVWMAYAKTWQERRAAVTTSN